MKRIKRISDLVVDEYYLFTPIKAFTDLSGVHQIMEVQFSRESFFKVTGSSKVFWSISLFSSIIGPLSVEKEEKEKKQFFTCHASVFVPFFKKLSSEKPVKGTDRFGCMSNKKDAVEAHTSRWSDNKFFITIADKHSFNLDNKSRNVMLSRNDMKLFANQMLHLVNAC